LAPLRPFLDEAYAATAADDALVGIPLQAFGRPVGVITGMVGDIESIDADLVALWLELGFHTALALEYREAIESARAGGEVHERARLNQELHDTVSQDLFALSLLAAGVEGDLHSVGSDDIQAEVRELRSVVESTSADVRALIGQRRRASGGMGLEERLSLITDRLSVQTGIDIRASVAGDWRDLSPEFVDDAVHIVQEALRNIVKHAHARRAMVRVSADPLDSDALVIEIVDDGMGFDPAAAGESSFGLATIRERAAGHGGSVEIRTAPSTTLQVRMPAAYASEWDAARRPASP
jgi:signal transduction histidine kinase